MGIMPTIEKSEGDKTPALVLHREPFLRLLREYQKIGRVFYPVKSNSAREILTLVRDSGAGFLVSCPFYLDALIGLGVGADKILYDNCAAEGEEIKRVCAAGVRFFYTDSGEHAAEVKAHTPHARFLIKVSAEPATGKRGKYGVVDFSALEEQLSGAGALAGFGFYIPDSSFCAETLEKELDFIFSRTSSKRLMLNIGGSLKGLLHGQRERSLLASHRERGFFEEVLLEPGRNLLNPCIVMETRVMKRRTLNGVERLHVDASIYSGLMDVYIEGKKLIIRTEGGAGDTPYEVYGKTSDSADFLGVHRLPENLAAGDKLLIADCGAYCRDMDQAYGGAKRLAFRVFH